MNISWQIEMNGIVNEIAVDRIGITIDSVSLCESMFSANENVFIKLVPTNNKKMSSITDQGRNPHIWLNVFFNRYELN